MRCIIDFVKDGRYFGIPLPDGHEHELEKICEIDFVEDVGLNIFLRDKRNTILTISKEDLEVIRLIWVGDR